MSHPDIVPARVSRRRALAIMAGGAAASLLPGRSFGMIPDLYVWTGTALGAPATIRLYHRDRRQAESAIAVALDEIERLENEFSLYRSDSALSRLNRDGRLWAPSHDMRRLLALSWRFGDLTGGVFDVTVQPLWEVYARHFANHPGDPTGPSPIEIAAARRRVDYRRIHVSAEAATLEPGAAVTLNGIAQGYITDRVADLLRARGWANVLVDLGELQALDGHIDGTPWQIAIPGTDADGSWLGLADGALATSAPHGTVFDRDGRFGHLFDPRRGWVKPRYQSVTVLARDATTADALSTAFALLPPEPVADLARAAGLTAVWAVDLGGNRRCVHG